jgi:hypothetical protein
MPIGTTFSRQMDITTICLRAYNLAGLVPAEMGATGVMWDRRTPFAKDLLQSILDELETEGVFARDVTFFNVTLVSGTFIYDLPANIFDVVGDGAYIAASETSLTQAAAESPVIQRDRETWQRMSAKSAQSKPTIFFTDRQADPTQVRLWPVPNEAGTIRFQGQRLLADVTDGNATVDLERYWQQYLIFELGSQLAIAANKLEHGSLLAQKAAMKKERAKAAANQGTSSFMLLDHYTGWN